MRTKLKPGDYFVWCQRTGFKVPASEIMREWNGLLVWNRVYEPRHPQDFVRGVTDDQSIPFGNPKPENVFLGDNEITADDL
jgi:hypothetical protein